MSNQNLLDANRQPEKILPITSSFEYLIYPPFLLYSYHLLSQANNAHDGNFFLYFSMYFALFGLVLIVQIISAFIHLSHYNGGKVRIVYLASIGLALVAIALTAHFLPESLDYVFVWAPNIPAWAYVVVCFLDSRKRKAQLAKQ